MEQNYVYFAYVRMCNCEFPVFSLHVNSSLYIIYENRNSSFYLVAFHFKQKVSKISTQYVHCVVPFTERTYTTISDHNTLR